MKLAESVLRSIIREELKEQSGLRRSMKYSKAAKPAYDAVRNEDRDEHLLELRSMLHAAENVMLDGERLIHDDRYQEARIILEEIQNEGRD